MTNLSSKSFGLLKRLLTPDKPYHAQWLLTRRCNYRCGSCGVWRDQENLNELSTDDVKKGLDILRKLGVVELVLSGGNPLLRDDITEIIEYASRFFITTVYDNGSMAVKKINALRKADFVAISLDTLNEKKYDHMRGVPGAWRKAMQAIRTLNDEGIVVGVSPTISGLNLHEIIDFTRHFAQSDIPVWYCLYQYDNPTESQLFGIGEKNSELEINDKKTMVDICNRLVDMKRKYSRIFITTKTLFALKHLFQSGQRIWTCKALRSFLTVNHIGRVAGCHLKKPASSIFELLDAWDSPRFKDLRKEYSRCTQCAYLCYIFYSLYSTIQSNMEIVRDQWKNVGWILTEKIRA